MLMDSQKHNENVSKFLSTTDYVLVRPISIARFLRTVCKLGGAIPLAPGYTHVTNKHMPALYPYRIYGLISATQFGDKDGIGSVWLQDWLREGTPLARPKISWKVSLPHPITAGTDKDHPLVYQVCV